MILQYYNSQHILSVKLFNRFSVLFKEYVLHQTTQDAKLLSTSSQNVDVSFDVTCIRLTRVVLSHVVNAVFASYKVQSSKLLDAKWCSTTVHSTIILWTSQIKNIITNKNRWIRVPAWYADARPVSHKASLTVLQTKYILHISDKHTISEMEITPSGEVNFRSD